MKKDLKITISPEISEYMRSLALKGRAVVAKKYAVEGGKNSLYSAMAKRRWAKQKNK